MGNTNNKKSKSIRSIGVIGIIAIILAVVLFLVIKNIGSNNESGNISQTDPTPTSANETGKSKYYFEYNGVDVEVDAAAAPITEALGEPIHYFEAQSCAFEGMDKVYTYSGFDLQTYTKNNNDYVFSISFLDDTVTTKEGIGLSATLEDVTKVYGNDYEISFNQYNYIEDNCKLSFIIEDDEVVSIEYALVIEE